MLDKAEAMVDYLKLKAWESEAELAFDTVYHEGYEDDMWDECDAINKAEAARDEWRKANPIETWEI